MKAALLKLVCFASAFVVLTAVVWSGSWLTNDAWDRYWLLILNPDTAYAIVDGLMLLVSKISMSLAAIMVVFWLAVYGLTRNGVVPATAVEWTFRLAGLVLAIALATSPHWYKAREIEWVFYLGAAIIPLGVEFVLDSFRICDEKTQKRILFVLLLLLVSVVLTYLVRNVIAHGIAPRPRPLDAINQNWNGAIRVVHDERVRGGSSYVSGHASTVFAMASMLVYWIRIRPVQIGLVAWALLLAYSRVYLAAHYPYCVIMGALLGIGSTWATILILAPGSRKHSFAVRRFRPPGHPV